MSAPPSPPLPPLTYPKLVQLKASAQRFSPLPTPTLTILPRRLGGLERGGCLALATPTSRLLGLQTPVPRTWPNEP